MLPGDADVGRGCWLRCDTCGAKASPDDAIQLQDGLVLVSFPRPCWHTRAGMAVVTRKVTPGGELP